MDQVKLTLPDGSVREVPAGTNALQVAEEIGPRLAMAACAATLDGAVVDLTQPITEDAEFAILTFKDDEGKRVYWHLWMDEAGVPARSPGAITNWLRPPNGSLSGGMCSAIQWELKARPPNKW